MQLSKNVPFNSSLIRSGVVPLAEAADNPLAFGPQCWLLEAPAWFDPVTPAVGRLGLWKWDPPPTAGEMLRIVE